MHTLHLIRSRILFVAIATSCLSFHTHTHTHACQLSATNCGWLVLELSLSTYTCLSTTLSICRCLCECFFVCETQKPLRMIENIKFENLIFTKRTNSIRRTPFVCMHFFSIHFLKSDVLSHFFDLGLFLFGSFRGGVHLTCASILFYVALLSIKQILRSLHFSTL